MLNAYICHGLRSPFGRAGGALAAVRPDDLLAALIRPLVDQSPFEQDAIDDVVIGCANQAGEDSRCVARHAALLAGLPVEVPGTVIQRNCGSGLGALITATHAITSGEANVTVVGGVESMSRSPFVVGKTDRPYSRNLTWHDSALGARFPNPRLSELYGDDSMPKTADNLAEEYKLSREECDTFAFHSQQRWAAAHQAGFFKDEIQTITVTGGRRKPDVMVDTDEHPRPDTNLERLAKLRLLNNDGVTTAGNASGINDGAVAMIVASKEAAEGAGAKPIARVVASAVAGVTPRIMGIGPVPASQKALERAGLTLADMDTIEINEAFAAQVLACLKGLDVAFDDGRVNPNGGAIAIGHPLGASGPRLVLTAINQLRKTNGRYALVTMCIGVGQGIAVILELV